MKIWDSVYISLLSGIYPLPAMHSLLVTLNVTEYLIGINQRLNSLYPVNANINYIILMKSKL